MEFEIYVKKGRGYEKRKIIPEPNSNGKFFKSLKLLIEEQIDIIRKHILSFENDENEISLTKPVHSDWEIQKKLDKLVHVRKVNLVALDRLRNILQEDDFIICEWCGSQMYKVPLNVPYKKFGSSYLYDVEKYKGVKYNYSCSNKNCHCAVDVQTYEQKQNLLEYRQELIRKGYNYVPNEFGYWNWINNGKPDNKPPIFDEDEKECNHVIDREFKYIDGKEDAPGYLKIIEKCLRCKKKWRIDNN